MRILTPAEVREVEQIRQAIYRGIGGSNMGHWNEINERDYFVIDADENKELWLNVLDMALQANEAMLLAWRRSSNVNLVEMVKQNE